MPFRILAQGIDISPTQLGAAVGILGIILGAYIKLRHLEDHLRGKGEVREISPQPFLVQPAPVFATVERVEKVENDLQSVQGEMRAGFESLREDRSRSTGTLHERIAEMDAKGESRTQELRKEIKADMKGVHDRINDVLGAVRSVGAGVDLCQKIHLRK